MGCCGSLQGRGRQRGDRWPVRYHHPAACVGKLERRDRQATVAGVAMDRPELQDAAARHHEAIVAGGVEQWCEARESVAVRGSPTIELGQIRRAGAEVAPRSEEHTSELQSLMRISYAVFCLKK